ncbi:FAD-dependent monooxygenase [Pseudonocardia ailaonensis]|uniref:FAD-dependent monooxygenase n=2 Tax=Pseudonocardia ailaonensis TaxID=367279 RepID=A0ABN2N7R4_9PSEU
MRENMRENIVETDVLVAGAGPAGLATAVAAAAHGARVLVVERRPGTSTIPRATGISTHTMEIFREWGVAAAVAAGAVDCEPTVAVARSLVDPHPQVVPSGFPGRREALRASPMTPLLCGQDHIEPVLVDAVRRRGGRVRFDTALTGLTVRAGGVVAELGGGERVRARFVVAADGPRSTVREALGVGVEQLGRLGDWAQVLFRPDLAELLGRRPHVLWTITHPDAEGVLLPVGGGRWSYARRWDCRTERPADFTFERWTTLLRAATGLPRLEPEILGMQLFTMAAAVSDTMRSGPGFVVGDAAHRMTPVGGAGMNTAIHDGHELGWRLGWVLRGWAGDALLDSFADEREPVGRARALRSLRMGEPSPLDGLAGDLGRTYRSTAVLDDGDAPAEGHHRTARPGERAPHAGVRTRSGSCVADALGPGFTLVTGPEPGAWTAAAAACASPPVRVVSLRASQAVARYRLGPASAVLLRPDGVVAWRSDAPVPATAALRTAVDRLTARSRSARAA